MRRWRVTAVVTVEVACDDPVMADVIAAQGIQIRRELTPDRSIPLVRIIKSEELSPTIIEPQGVIDG